MLTIRKETEIGRIFDDLVIKILIKRLEKKAGTW